MSFALVRSPGPPSLLSLDAFARRSGLHPQLVERYVALGLLEPVRDGGHALWFRPSALITVARIQRLRAGLAVNYAAIGLILDLLDRIDELQVLAHTAGGSITRGGSSWTSTG
jgi:DNA-binding transcriptional MerR regulator